MRRRITVFDGYEEMYLYTLGTVSYRCITCKDYGLVVGAWYDYDTDTFSTTHPPNFERICNVLAFGSWKVIICLTWHYPEFLVTYSRFSSRTVPSGFTNERPYNDLASTTQFPMLRWDWRMNSPSTPLTQGHDAAEPSGFLMVSSTLYLFAQPMRRLLRPPCMLVTGTHIK